MTSLSDEMEFDHVIEVKEDGSVIHRADLCAPELIEGYLWYQPGEKWELLNGFSGQHGYSGPVMHPSEYIGGGLEKYLWANPGIYVVIVSYDIDAEEGDDDTIGWAIAHLVEK